MGGWDDDYPRWPGLDGRLVEALTAAGTFGADTWDLTGLVDDVWYPGQPKTMYLVDCRDERWSAIGEWRVRLACQRLVVAGRAQQGPLGSRFYDIGLYPGMVDVERMLHARPSWHQKVAGGGCACGGRWPCSTRAVLDAVDRRALERLDRGEQSHRLVDGRVCLCGDWSCRRWVPVSAFEHRWRPAPRIPAAAGAAGHR